MGSPFIIQRPSKGKNGGHNQQGVSSGQVLEGRKGKHRNQQKVGQALQQSRRAERIMEMQEKLKGKVIKMRRKSSSLCVFRPSIPSPRPYKHSMWWPKKTIDGNRLLSRGEELRLGCPAPGLVTGVLSWGAQARIEGSPTGFAPGRPFSLT